MAAVAKEDEDKEKVTASFQTGFFEFFLAVVFFFFSLRFSPPIK